MVLVVVIGAGAIVAGWLAGGKVANLAHLDLRGLPLVFAALACQLVVLLPGALTGTAAPWLMAASQLLLVMFVLGNRHLPGMPLVGIGFGLNALVIVANGGMPVSGRALVTVGGPGADVVRPGTHLLLESGHRLPALADVIAVPALRSVLSVGDLVLAAGVGLLVVTCMRRYPSLPGRRARPAPTPRWRRDSTAQPVDGGEQALSQGGAWTPAQDLGGAGDVQRDA